MYKHKKNKNVHFNKNEAEENGKRNIDKYIVAALEIQQIFSKANLIYDIIKQQGT